MHSRVCRREDDPNRELARKAEQFRALHVPGKPVVLVNIWDPGSAKAVAAEGARALATGSWSVANATGYQDGERTPLALAIDNLVRIARATDLPVSVDLEGGYGSSPSGVGNTVERAIGAGAIGCNLEDSVPVSGQLRTAADQALRVDQARRSADALMRGFFINARTDVFYQRPPDQHDEHMIDEALERARQYADAGADGLFVPGLSALRLMERLTRRSPLPVNIMVGDGSPALRALAEHGVARVSHGPGPYLVAMRALQHAARQAVMGESS
jgi:2-methylisocitrate lyase-like PEP mutase family enzyme